MSLKEVKVTYVLWALGAIMFGVSILSLGAIHSDIQIIIVVVSFGFGVVFLSIASVCRKIDRLLRSQAGDQE